MDSFTFNLSGTVRQKTRGSATYLVADATLIVPGVLNGSQGPLHYPEDEVAKSAKAWNNVPILVNHPPVGRAGKDVLASQGIGHVANSRFVGHRLKASLWFNVDRTKQLDPRIHDAVSTFQKVELSTGLGMDAKPAEAGAVFNHPLDGPIEYTHTVSNYRPDHVAILPEQIGACSVRDGCGVNNEAGSKSQTDTGSSTAIQGGQQMLTAEQKTAIVDELIANECCWEEEHRDELMGASDVVLNQVKIIADKQAVDAEALAAAEAGFDDGRDAITFNQEKKAWERETKPEKKDEEGKTVDNATPTKQLTKEEWLASAPVEVRNTYDYAEKAEQAARKSLIEQITANVSNDKKPGVVAELGKESPERLQMIASLMPESSAQSRGPDFYGGQPAVDIGSTVNEADQNDQLIPEQMEWAPAT